MGSAEWYQQGIWKSSLRIVWVVIFVIHFLKSRWIKYNTPAFSYCLESTRLSVCKVPLSSCSLFTLSPISRQVCLLLHTEVPPCPKFPLLHFRWKSKATSPSVCVRNRNNHSWNFQRWALLLQLPGLWSGGEIHRIVMGSTKLGLRAGGGGNARGSEAFERAAKGTAGHFQHSGMGAPIMRL